MVVLRQLGRGDRMHNVQFPRLEICRLLEYEFFHFLPPARLLHPCGGRDSYRDDHRTGRDGYRDGYRTQDKD